jgi:ubiquinol-cytochrome c reductase iron-sulfur subunit
VSERRAERIVLGAFAVTIVAGLALLGLYLAGGQTQLEAVLLALCLGGIGVGIVVWGNSLLPEIEQEEPRHSLASTATGDAMSPEPPGITRRTALVRMLVAAFGGLAAALAIPIFSLGPAPGRSLFETSWRSGKRLVDPQGVPVRADDLPVGGILTVFPEGATDAADSQTVLIHVEPGLLRPEGEAAVFAPHDYVAYSKVCTHAGCPVGLYRAPDHILQCPCHQSAFDVLSGARPVGGPAVRPLPQLPIRLQPDGTFVALGDFPAPVGPSFWDIGG